MSAAELTALPRSPSLPMFFDNLDSFVEAPEGVAKLRELILDLAVRGKLVEQDENDEPVSVSIQTIERIKSRLLDKKKIQKDKKFAPTVASDPPWEIPDAWSWVRLQHAFEVVRGGSPRPAGDPRYFGGDIPWITVREITKDDGKFLTETRDFITELGSEKSRFVHPDDLLLTNSGATLGVPKINKITGCINDGVAFLNCFHDLIDKEFAYYFLTQQTPAFRAVNQGMGQPNLNTPILAGWFFPLPPLSEQRRIVSKVDGLMSLCDELESRGTERVRLREQASCSCLDRLVSSRSRRDLSSAWQRLSDHFEVLYASCETVAQLRQSILQLAVQGKLVPQDPNDEPAEELLVRCEKERKRLADANKISTKRRLPEVESDEREFDAPPGWAWARINHFCDHRLGKMLDKAKNKGTFYPYLRNTNVQWLEFDLSDMKEMRYEDDELEEFEVRSGDLMVCEGGHPGRCAIWQSEIQPMMFQKAIHRVRPLGGIEPQFLLLRLWCDFNRRHLDQFFTGATIKHFTGKELARYVICVPPLGEQKRIVAKVDQLLSQCDELSARLRERQSASQGLLNATIHHLLNHETLEGQSG